MSQCWTWGNKTTLVPADRRARFPAVWGDSFWAEYPWWGGSRPMTRRSNGRCFLLSGVALKISSVRHFHPPRCTFLFSSSFFFYQRNMWGMSANNRLAASPCVHGKIKLADHALYSLLKSHLEKGGLPRFCPETACMDVATINPLTAAFEHFLWLRDTNVRGNKHGQTEVKESTQRRPYCHQSADNLKVSPFAVPRGFGRLCPWQVFFTVGDW